jgi:hypothetical protein
MVISIGMEDDINMEPQVPSQQILLGKNIMIRLTKEQLFEVDKWMSQKSGVWAGYASFVRCAVNNYLKNMEEGKIKPER